jgi:hypothetical protein
LSLRTAIQKPDKVSSYKLQEKKPFLNSDRFQHFAIATRRHAISSENFKSKSIVYPNLEGVTIQQENGELLNDSDIQAIAERIWLEGLASWLDYRVLRSLYMHAPYLEMTLILLDKINKLLTGASIPYPIELAQNTAKIYEAVKSHNFLIKIVSKNNVHDFIAQLQDYHYCPALRCPHRPALRCPQTNKPTHKFVHLTGEIRPYIKTNKLDFKSMKKTSVTMMNTHLSTPLFGEHNDDRVLVGFGFLKDKTMIKARLLSDKGTYLREWRGSAGDVTKYAESAKFFNYTDEQQFIEKINQPYSFVNEVLAQLTRESVYCIIMGRDRPEERDNAIFYQDLVKNKLKLMLPIFIYDSDIQALVPFDKDIYSLNSDHSNQAVKQGCSIM